MSSAGIPAKTCLQIGLLLFSLQLLSPNRIHILCCPSQTLCKIPQHNMGVMLLCSINLTLKIVAKNVFLFYYGFYCGDVLVILVHSEQNLTLMIWALTGSQQRSWFSCPWWSQLCPDVDCLCNLNNTPDTRGKTPRMLMMYLLICFTIRPVLPVSYVVCMLLITILTWCLGFHQGLHWNRTFSQLS